MKQPKRFPVSVPPQSSYMKQMVMATINEKSKKQEKVQHFELFLHLNLL